MRQLYARDAVLAYLDTSANVDALYAVTRVLAVGARVALRLHGLQPHQDLVFVGEDSHLTALRDTGLASFDHPSMTMAREAARLVMDAVSTGQKEAVGVRFQGNREIERHPQAKEEAET